MGGATSKPGAAEARAACAASDTVHPAAQAIDSTAQEVVSKRADQLNLPERLTLGLSVDAIDEYIAALPTDAVEQCNEDRPTINGVRVPANASLNGYVNQWLAARFSEANGGKAYCETLYERGDRKVGVATVFVSWFLETPLATLVDALRQYLRLHPELPPDTKFWVCDFVIRQSTRRLDVTMNDVKRLGDCVRAVGHTVLLMEPWDDPAPLRRAYCIKEVYHTQASGARFEVVMSAEQQAAFETALVDDFASIAKKLSEVDVRKAECRNPRDTEQILGELEREVGLTECNKAVFGLLRGALAGQGRAALERMEPAERAPSTLINNLSRLLKEQGDLDGAEALYREALEAKRETLGDRHPSTLTTISNLSSLLSAKGNLDGAEALCREALEGQRWRDGDRHPLTLRSINNLGMLLKAKGDLDGAEALLREALEGFRETLGDRHPHTLTLINNLGSLLKNKTRAQDGSLYDRGDLDGAEALYREALEARRETLSDRHPDTLTSIGNLGSLLSAKGDLDGAEALYREALGGCRETLGDRHPDTLISINNLGLLLKAKGDLDGAEALYREDLQASRGTLGDRHPHTLTSLCNLGSLLYAKGDLDGTEALLREALEGRRETLGAQHPDTLFSTYNLGILLQKQGRLGDAIPLFQGELEGCAAQFGKGHRETRASARKLVEVLTEAGRQRQADEIAATHGV